MNVQSTSSTEDLKQTVRGETVESKRLNGSHVSTVVFL